MVVQESFEVMGLKVNTYCGIVLRCRIFGIVVECF